MPHQLDNSSVVTSWLPGGEIWNISAELPFSHKNHHHFPPQQQAPSLISNLSSLFLSTINYYNLTKHEALDAIGYFLYEHDDSIHSQLFDCFIDHHLLIYNGDQTNRPYYTFNYHSIINGIFTPLTKCYSPSCQHNNITCYSPLCPNKRISSILRIVNQTLYNSDQQQQTNNGNKDRDITEQEQSLDKDWIQSIPSYIRDCTSRKELKRQAGIAELVATEQNYCQDLDILHRIYAIPLLESSEVISNPSRRQRFYNNVFGNYLDITHLHQSFHNQLTCHNRQSSFFIGRVGTIIMQHVTNLMEPYIQYASNHVKAIYCMTIEHKNNPQFAKFLATQNALKCTRRLGLRHYLTGPTLWMGKLKLMIEAILKNTVDDADQLSLKASLAILHDTLCRMNSCAKLSPEELRFEELSTSIYTLASGSGGSDLQLLAIPDNSVLIREEAVWLARSTHPLQPSLCQVFLFSHALILTHPRMTNGRTEYIVISGSPIPIQFLSFGNSNASTSMIRRLSFASTSMVSTPLHLISNLRRQKSMNSETSTNSSASNSSHSSTSNSNSSSGGAGLRRKNTTINIISPTANTKLSIQRSPTSISADRKNRILLPFQIRTRLSKLKKSFRTSLSLPNSLTYHKEINSETMSRRDSAPASLCSYQQQQHQEQQQGQQEQQRQQQRRTLKICHMAYPDNAFKLEFLTRSDRMQWENVVRDVMMNSERSSQIFKMKMICKSLTMPSLLSPSSSTATSSVVGSGIIPGRIKCAYTFAFNGKMIVALGTQHGVWVGSKDNSISFQLVLSNQDVHQLNVLQDNLLVLNHDNKQNSSSLIAYKLKSIIVEEQEQIQTCLSLDWCAVKRSMVIRFTTGELKNQSVIAYLTKRLQSIWLVLVVPGNHASDRSNWYKKIKREYKVAIRDPTDIQIIGDSIFVRSDRYGVERIDVSSFAANDGANNYICSGSNVGLLSYAGNGLICDSQSAYSISLFKHNHAAQQLIRTKFESQVHNIAIIYPYLVAFSSSVIEIRNIETTELVQAIRGNHIQYISITNDHTQPLLFTMMNDESKTTASIYQLQLSL